MSSIALLFLRNRSREACEVSSNWLRDCDALSRVLKPGQPAPSKPTTVDHFFMLWLAFANPSLLARIREDFLLSAENDLELDLELTISQRFFTGHEFSCLTSSWTRLSVFILTVQLSEVLSYVPNQSSLGIFMGWQ